MSIWKHGYDPRNHALPYGGALHKGDTSALAGASVDKGALRELVWREFVACGHDGSTCDEMEKWTGLSHQTASARIRELVIAGDVVDSGWRRKTRSHRNAIVWRVARVEPAAAEKSAGPAECATSPAPAPDGAPQ